MTKLASFTFTCLIVTLMILIAQAKDEKYSSKYDHIDVDAVLANFRLRTQYVRCFLDISPCNTGASRFLKEVFPEALITKCKKCTDKQVYTLNAITEWFTKNEPETWDRILRIAINEIQKKNA